MQRDRIVVKKINSLNLISVILRFIIRNIHLVFCLVPCMELLKPLEPLVIRAVKVSFVMLMRHPLESP